MKLHNFSMVVKIPCNQIRKNELSDAIVSCINGRLVMEFDRPGATVRDAIRSAGEAISAAGGTVL